jgi:hypothetical protein
MESILQEIKGCMDSGNWYAAVTLTMILPDICATLGEPKNARKNGIKSRYMSWCKNHLADVSGFNPELFYELRCGVVHTGALKHPKFERVALSIPGQTTLHNIIVHFEGALTLFLDAETLVSEVCTRVQHWWLENRDSDLVRERAPRVISRGVFKGGPFGSVMAFVSDLR